MKKTALSILGIFALLAILLINTEMVDGLLKFVGLRSEVYAMRDALNSLVQLGDGDILLLTLVGGFGSIVYLFGASECWSAFLRIAGFLFREDKRQGEFRSISDDPDVSALIDSQKIPIIVTRLEKRLPTVSAPTTTIAEELILRARTEDPTLIMGGAHEHLSELTCPPKLPSF